MTNVVFFVVLFIIGIIMMAVLTSLTNEEFSSALSMSKTDLQAKLRLIMDSLVKDVRQTNLIQINTNNPTGDFIPDNDLMKIVVRKDGYRVGSVVEVAGQKCVVISVEGNSAAIVPVGELAHLLHVGQRQHRAAAAIMRVLGAHGGWHDKKNHS
jgi:hypothetical protein